MSIAFSFATMLEDSSSSINVVMTYECRWGQVFILDALSKYRAADAREAENIVERVTPRLQHANCAVVLSAVKVDVLSLSITLNRVFQEYYNTTVFPFFR